MKAIHSPIILLLSSIFIGINSHEMGMKIPIPVFKENFNSALNDVQNQVSDATDQLNLILASIGKSSAKAAMLMQKSQSIIDWLHATMALTPDKKFICPTHTDPKGTNEQLEMKLDVDRGLCYLYDNDFVAGDADSLEVDDPLTWAAAETYCAGLGGTLLQPSLTDTTLAKTLTDLFPALLTAAGGPVFIGACSVAVPGATVTYQYQFLNGYILTAADLGLLSLTAPVDTTKCLGLAAPQVLGSPVKIVPMLATTPAGYICQFTPQTIFPPFQESNLDPIDDTQMPDSEELVDVEAGSSHHHYNGGYYSMEEHKTTSGLPRPEPNSGEIL